MEGWMDGWSEVVVLSSLFFCIHTCIRQVSTCCKAWPWRLHKIRQSNDAVTKSQKCSSKSRLQYGVLRTSGSTGRSSRDSHSKRRQTQTQTQTQMQMQKQKQKHRVDSWSHPYAFEVFGEGGIYVISLLHGRHEEDDRFVWIAF